MAEVSVFSWFNPMRRTDRIQIYRISLKRQDTAIAYMEVSVRRPGGRAKQDARAVLSRGMTNPLVIHDRVRPT